MSILGSNSGLAKAFDAALSKGNTDFCLRLLNQTPSLAFATLSSASGKQSLLGRAVETGNAEVCDALLSRGAHMNVPTKHAGETHSPMSKTLSPAYLNVPTHREVVDVFTKHVAARGAQAQAPSRFDALADRVGKAFDKSVNKLEKVFRSDTVGVTGALGAAMGVSLATITAPLLLNGLATIAVGFGLTVAHHSWGRAFPDKQKSLAVGERRQEHADSVYKHLAASYSGDIAKAPVAQAGQHIGKVVAVQDGYAVQSTGRGSFVKHEIAKMGKAPAVGQSLNVQYGRDGAVSVKNQGQGQQQGNER